MTLIDAETMWECETCFYHLSGRCTAGWCDCGEGYRPAMSKLKVIEAEPIVHAHWNKLGSVWECSNCYETISMKRYMEDRMLFCNACGAKMDEVVE